MTNFATHLFNWLPHTRKQNAILLFHRVVSDTTDPWLLAALSGEVVTQSVFAQQMAWLQQNYQITSLDELLTQPTGSPQIALTFDDGFADNLIHAGPVLDQLKLPATVFVVADKIGAAEGMWHHRVARWASTHHPDMNPSDGRKGRPKRQLAQFLRQLDDDLETKELVQSTPHSADRFLDADELRQLQALGIDIQSHTLSHRVLAELPDDALERELEQAQRQLELLTGSTVDKIAYPVGRAQHIDRRTLKLAQHIYRFGFVAQPGYLQPAAFDSHLIPRIGTRNSVQDLRKRLRKRYPAVVTPAR